MLILKIHSLFFWDSAWNENSTLSFANPATLGVRKLPPSNACSHRGSVRGGDPHSSSLDPSTSVQFNEMIKYFSLIYFFDFCLKQFDVSSWHLKLYNHQESSPLLFRKLLLAIQSFGRDSILFYLMNWSFLAQFYFKDFIINNHFFS